MSRSEHQAIVKDENKRVHKMSAYGLPPSTFLRPKGLGLAVTAHWVRLLALGGKGDLLSGHYSSLLFSVGRLGGCCCCDILIKLRYCYYYHHYFRTSFLALSTVGSWRHLMCNFYPATSRDSLLVIERRTRDRKVASSNTSRSGGRIFFSRVNFAVLTLIRCPLHPSCYRSGT